ncbi:hypothetical protein BJ875DRAFT_454062 [Amylocarpus encephaloides]|uniref:Uncharacterized protein n=1 Tax=Amylocarpus encephaloides TaxID=45428 RepID=A0A9P7YPE7_9HELO|nr:hypothetical protein BJ875DRAFT_454062 [Amylocarpus encephaloides]
MLSECKYRQESKVSGLSHHLARMALSGLLWLNPTASLSIHSPLPLPVLYVEVVMRYCTVRVLVLVERLNRSGGFRLISAWSFITPAMETADSHVRPSGIWETEAVGWRMGTRYGDGAGEEG